MNTEQRLNITMESINSNSITWADAQRDFSNRYKYNGSVNDIAAHLAKMKINLAAYINLELKEF